MTRKFNSDLRNEIPTLFPDNITKDISPATLRQFLEDLIDSLRATGSQLTQEAAPTVPNGGIVSVTTTPQKLVFFDTVFNGDTTELEGDIALDRFIVNNATGALEMDSTFTMEGSNSADVTLELYKNGLATGNLISANLEGAGNPVTIPALAKDIPLTLNDYFEIYVYAGGSVTVTFTKSRWFAKLVSSRNPA